MPTGVKKHQVGSTSVPCLVQGCNIAPDVVGEGGENPFGVLTRLCVCVYVWVCVCASSVCVCVYVCACARAVCVCVCARVGGGGGGACAQCAYALSPHLFRTPASAFRYTCLWVHVGASAGRGQRSHRRERKSNAADERFVLFFLNTSYNITQVQQ